MLDQYQKILVTGGCGFIGRHLVSALRTLDKSVVVLDNFSTASDTTIPEGIMLSRVDVRDRTATSEAVEGADLIFHIAANANGTVSVDDPRFDFETNVIGTLNMLDAALLAVTMRFVYLSSASVYGRPQRFPMDEAHPTNPFVPYGTSKLAAELYCHTYADSYGLDVVVGRPFCVYGPGEHPNLALVEVSRFLRWHLNHKPIQLVGDVDRKTRDFVHVRDIVQGLLLIAEKGETNESYNLGSGEEVSMRELTDVIGAASGRSAVIHEISEITEDTYRLVADISKLSALGYAPTVSLKDGITELIEQLGEYPELPGGTTIFKKDQQAELA